jgi:hypothetical protein
MTSTNPSMASVEGPAGPLNASGIFRLKGVKDSKNVTVKIQARLGSAEGPVLGELEPHIFQLRELRVRAHIISINPPASGPDAASTTAQTPASLVDVFDGANRIFRAAGIKFLYNQAETRFGSISGFAAQGTMTTNLSGKPPTFGEFSKLINMTTDGKKPDPNAINVYFIRNANEVLGLTFDHDEPRPSGFGVVIADFQNNTTANPDFGRVTAHELGHYLDSDIHANQNAAAKNIRADIVSRRRLMFSAASIRADTEPAYRRDVGYGALTPGNLLTVKDLGPDPNDGEVARNRRRAQNPN